MDYSKAIDGTQLGSTLQIIGHERQIGKKPGRLGLGTKPNKLPFSRVDDQSLDDVRLKMDVQWGTHPI